MAPHIVSACFLVHAHHDEVVILPQCLNSCKLDKHKISEVFCSRLLLLQVTVVHMLM